MMKTKVQLSLSYLPTCRTILNISTHTEQINKIINI